MKKHHYVVCYDFSIEELEVRISIDILTDYKKNFIEELVSQDDPRIKITHNNILFNSILSKFSNIHFTTINYSFLHATKASPEPISVDALAMLSEQEKLNLLSDPRYVFTQDDFEEITEHEFVCRYTKHITNSPHDTFDYVFYRVEEIT